ncbi:hypothetical protein TNCV_916851 [Trichonephila clavipes]|nr:hypothetical protein TNCV_916851 [Trichonephila clavipes]
MERTRDPQTHQCPRNRQLWWMRFNALRRHHVGDGRTPLHGGSEDIQRVDWPGMSPVLNPIEHVWDTLERAISTRNPIRERSRK